MAFTVRPTRLEDYEAVFGLVHDSGVSMDFTKDMFRKMLEHNPDCYFVAEADGKIIGNVFGMHDGAFRGYIGSLVVADDYRRQSVASALVENLLDRYRELGLNRVFAHILKSNEASLALFRKLGMNPSDGHYVVDNLH